MTQLLARDLDNDPLVFGVVGEEASRFFAVESVTGVVWLRQPLDREVTLLGEEKKVPAGINGDSSPFVAAGVSGIQVSDVSCSPCHCGDRGGNKQGALVPSGLLFFMDLRIIFASSEVKKTINGNDPPKRGMLIHSGKFTASLFKPMFQ